MDFKYQFQVLEGHLDTFGHVNNATYLELYEEARWQFITEGGFGLDKIKETKIGPVILEINLKFKKELTNRETITIESKSISNDSRLVMELSQKMIKDNGDVASTLELKVGVMDLTKRRLIEPPKEWLHAIGFNR